MAKSAQRVLTTINAGSAASFQPSRGDENKQAALRPESTLVQWASACSENWQLLRSSWSSWVSRTEKQVDAELLQHARLLMRPEDGGWVAERRELPGEGDAGLTLSPGLRCALKPPGRPLPPLISPHRGCTVTGVRRGSRAAAAGIERGMAVLQIGGWNLCGLTRAQAEAVAGSAAGTVVLLTPGTGAGERLEAALLPSYLTVKRQLMERFGEPAWGRCKHRVQRMLDRTHEEAR